MSSPDAEGLFAKLGLTPEATEAEVIKAYFALPADSRKQADSAYQALRNRFRGKEEPGAAEQEKLTDADGKPLGRLYQALGLPAEGSTLEKVGHAYRLSCKSLGPDDHARRGELDEAFEIVRAWHEKQGELVSPAPDKTAKSESVRALEQIAIENPQITHYLKILGLKPGAAPKAVAFAFKKLEDQRNSKPGATPGWAGSLEKLSDDEFNKAKHAHDGIMRVYQQKLQSGRSEKRRGLPKGLRVAAFLLVPVLATILIVMNLANIRANFVSFEPGDEVYLRQDSTHFGTIEAFDLEHRFDTSPDERVAAYQLRLPDSGTSIWVSEWFAKRALYVNE